VPQEEEEEEEEEEELERIFFFFFLRPIADHVLLILDVSRSHTTTHQSR
jgi:hypothetical protein